jgi:hypothetical protein
MQPVRTENETRAGVDDVEERSHVKHVEPRASAGLESFQPPPSAFQSEMVPRFSSTVKWAKGAAADFEINELRPVFGA